MPSHRSRAVAIAAVCLLASAASATVVMKLSMQEMTARAAVVVRGTVSRVEAKRHERGQIWTYAELLVTDGIKGSTKSAIVVKQPGGVVGEVGQRVSGAATFRPSEDVVLFLEPAVDEPGAFVVMSLTAGKVTFEDVRGVRAAVRHLDGVTFAEAGTRQTLHAIEPLEVLGPPEAFIAQLKGYVKQGAR